MAGVKTAEEFRRRQRIVSSHEIDHARPLPGIVALAAGIWVHGRRKLLMRLPSNISHHSFPAGHALRVLLLILAAFGAVQARAADRFDKAFLNQHLTAYTGHGFAWENNDIGVSEKAPAPWSAVKVTGGDDQPAGRRGAGGQSLAGPLGPAHRQGSTQALVTTLECRATCLHRRNALISSSSLFSTSCIWLWL